MPPYALIDKEVGETPLQALERFRATDSRLAEVPMTYAGRLDPMASGKLLILIGDECQHRENYDSLDKTYEFDVLFGAETDTGDVLGLVSHVAAFDPTAQDWEKIVATLVGSHYLPYPTFSSRTVNGAPLFEHAHRDAGVERPVREMRVKRATYEGVRILTNDALLHEIEEKLALLHTPDSNDFRIERILPRWHEILQHKSVFTIVSIKADVATGTYIRALAPRLARELRTRGLAFRIHRSAIDSPRRFMTDSERFA